MAAKSTWDSDEHTTYLIEFYDTVTWDEFHRSVDQAHKEIRVIDHPVNLLIAIETSLPNGFALGQFRTVMNHQPPNLQRIIIISPDSSGMLMFVKRLASVLQKSFPQKTGVAFANSLQEAQQILARPKSNRP